MPHITSLLTYTAVAAVFEVMPGPSVLLTVARSMPSGTRAGLMMALGVRLALQER